MQITQDITTHRQIGTVVALGFFDGIHLGHRAVIEKAAQLAKENGLRSMVFTFSVNEDVPASKTGLSLLHTEHQKNKMLEEMGIDEVVCPSFSCFKNLTPEQYVCDILCAAFNAKFVVSGENYHFGKQGIADVSLLRTLAGQHGIQVVTVPPVLEGGQVISSTRIRRAIRNGDLALAAKLLGTPFCIESEVVHGRQLGRTINSPTINQMFPKDFTIPPYGVYLSTVSYDSNSMWGVTNIGVKPTLGDNVLSCETHILDFTGDLYGKTVTLCLHRQLRPEKNFETVKALSEQIQLDIDLARKMSKNIDA